MIFINQYTRIPFKICLKTLTSQITKFSTASSAETVDLAYSSYENTTEENSTSPPVVILHGLLGSKNNWNSMSKAIHKTTGRKVISIDARNHGDSKHSPQHSYLHMAHDVMKLLKNLEISKVSLLGHSMGGRTAMVLSLLCSDLVSSLITVDISPVKTSPQIFSMVSLFDAMTAVSIRSGIAMSKARKLADEQLKGITPDVNLRNFLLTNLVQTNTGSYTWRVNIPALKENFQPNISSFPTSLKGLQYCGPTLFIGGALSDYIGKGDLPAIQEYFPLADLKFIEGAGHWVHSQKPEKFLEHDEEYRNNGIEINNRFVKKAKKLIKLKNLQNIPDFAKARKLPKDADFSQFLPLHQEMANEVVDALLAVPENQLEDFLSLCVFTRIHLNPQLFIYCFSIALTHRKDTGHIRLQNHAETFPSKFMDSIVFGEAREMAALSAQGAPRIPIIIPRNFTASDLDVEQRLAYFREDIGVNLHHWHWHLVYPFFSNIREIVAKDRRGELFYYMHQQIIARYNGERLNNSLARVKKFSNLTEPIPEAYFPKLDSLTSSRGYPPRQANMSWQNLNRPVEDVNITISDMQRWRRNIEDAIATGRVRMADGSTQPLDLDTLRNIFEASILSPNPQLYGTLHNNGHSFTAYMHDPTHRYLESFGVMADEAITMRDPFFHRWHEFIDDTFQKFKESQHVPQYTRSELDNPGVQIINARIVSDTGSENTLNTFWMQSDVDLTRGLDFTDRSTVYGRFTHLNHRDFRYVINATNSGAARRTTVRLFIAPKFDERNLPWILNDQRKMFVEMDRFVTHLNAGQNTITRESTQSSVSIPFEQTFRDLSRQGGDPRASDLASFNFCGCGWPQHMLVPKGTETGAQYELFVMLSNYDLDSVNNPNGTEMTCKEASSFCGLKDRLYPDRRSMGYPFDRPSSNATNLQDFLLPNMFRQDITITLQNTPVEQNPRNPTI